MTLPCGAWVIVPTVALVITESGLRSHGYCPSPAPRSDSGKMRTSIACSLPVGALDAGRGYVVARFDIPDVLLDEIGDDNIVGQRDGRGLALARRGRPWR